MFPDKPLKIIKVFNSLDIDDFFGFIDITIEIYKDVLRPFLPYRYIGKVLYPTGILRGKYFTEEIKKILRYKQGRIIEIHEAHTFEPRNKFRRMMLHFYDKKKNSIGPPKYLAKISMNSFYGFFGRKIEVNEFINVYNKDIPFFLVTRVVKNIIEINDEISGLVVSSNINHDTLSILNSTFKLSKEPNYIPIKTNVAIASAVTAYARMQMMDLKLDENVLYSDTDSIITSQELPPEFLGDELGLLKDELKGEFIKEAYFIGIKEYGYTYEQDGKLIEKSVFAGVKRDSLSFDEIKKIYNGETINITSKERLFKSLKNLTLEFKDVNLTLKKSNVKPLINNTYYPIHIPNDNEIKNKPSIMKIIIGYAKKHFVFRKLINKYFKIF